MYTKLKKHEEVVSCVRFSRSGNYLGSCSDDESIIIWNIIVVDKNIEMINRLTGHSDWVKNIDFLNDEKFIVFI